MFSWNNKPIRVVEHTRERHIQSYVDHEALKQSTKMITEGSDDSTYDTTFITSCGATLMLRVVMPSLVRANAPIRHPEMSLVGVKARHPWLDDKMNVVGYEPIQSDDAWRRSGRLLGAAVHEVIHEFQVHPPEIVEITDRGLTRIQRRTTMSGPPSETRMTQAYPPAAQRRSASHINQPPPAYDSSFASPPPPTIQLPPQFDEIETLSLSRAQELLDDEIGFMVFCHSLPIMVNARAKSKILLDANAAKAKTHLLQKESLDALSQHVTAVRDKLKERMEEFQSLQQQQDQLLAPPDEKITIRQLTVEKKQAEQASDRLASDWLEQGAQEPVKFVKDFVEQRKQMHAAAAKLELLKLQCRK